jgi:hypothetical protein
MKKILATVVTFVLLLGMMASPAFAGSHHIETLRDIHQTIHQSDIHQTIHQCMPMV